MEPGENMTSEHDRVDVAKSEFAIDAELCSMFDDGLCTTRGNAFDFEAEEHHKDEVADEEAMEIYEEKHEYHRAVEMSNDDLHLPVASSTKQSSPRRVLRDSAEATTSSNEQNIGCVIASPTNAGGSAVISHRNVLMRKYLELDMMLWKRMEVRQQSCALGHLIGRNFEVLDSVMLSSLDADVYEKFDDMFSDEELSVHNNLRQDNGVLSKLLVHHNTLKQSLMLTIGRIEQCERIIGEVQEIEANLLTKDREYLYLIEHQNLDRELKQMKQILKDGRRWYRFTKMCENNLQNMLTTLGQHDYSNARETQLLCIRLVTPFMKHTLKEVAIESEAEKRWRDFVKSHLDGLKHVLKVAEDTADKLQDWIRRAMESCPATETTETQPMHTVDMRTESNTTTTAGAISTAPRDPFDTIDAGSAGATEDTAVKVSRHTVIHKDDAGLAEIASLSDTGTLVTTTDSAGTDGCDVTHNAGADTAANETNIRDDT